MKKVLITGAGSYIGTSFIAWMRQWPEKYSLDVVATRNGEWEKHDFKEYDVVYIVAGIAHIKPTADVIPLYYQVNRDMVVQIAEKAKSAGVKQVIVLSSMSVYGITVGRISKSTQPDPKNDYGKSKLSADIELLKMNDTHFKIAILRPPMVYGGGCKGNYQLLSKLAKKIIFFPDYNNQRSMIYIDKLSEFVRRVIDLELSGIFHPQNAEYVKTTDMVVKIAEANGKKMHTTPIFNPLISLMVKCKFGIVCKVFGDLTYEMDVSDKIVELDMDFAESIVYTERENG